MDITTYFSNKFNVSPLVTVKSLGIVQDLASLISLTQ